MIIKYKCSNGDGTYSEGYLRRFKNLEAARKYLVKIHHSVEVIGEISIFDIKHAIKKALKEWSDEMSHYYDGYWKGYSTLSNETGYAVIDLKKAMKKLHEENEVELLHTSSDISRVAGRGWFLCDTD